MPSVDVFERQDISYRQSVLPKGVPVVAIEAGVDATWLAYTGGRRDTVIGMHTFGESAPDKAVFKHFGFTVEHVIQVVEKLLAQ